MQWICNRRDGTSSLEPAFGDILVATEAVLSLMVPFVSRDQVVQLITFLQGHRSNQHIRLRLLTAGDTRNYTSGGSDVRALEYLLQQDSIDLSVEIRATQGLHAKVYIADEALALVSSANLTDSGMRWNIEAGLTVDDRDLVRKIREDFDYVWEKAAQVTATDLELARKVIETAPSPREQGAPGAPDILFGSPTWSTVKTTPSVNRVPRKPSPTRKLNFSGFPRECLSWFRSDPKPSEREVKDNCALFRDRLDNTLFDLGSDLEKLMGRPADGYPERTLPSEIRALGWIPHVCNRRLLRTRFPEHWWVAMGRHEREYTRWAQLTVGISSWFGGSGFAGFLLDEEYEDNFDRPMFVRGALEHLDEFVSRVHSLAPGTLVSWRGVGGETIKVSAQELKQDHVLGFAADFSGKRLGIGIEYYLVAEEREALFSQDLLEVVVPKFEALYPFYHLALRSFFPRF